MIRGPMPTLTPADAAHAREEFLRGRSYREISRELAVSDQTVIRSIRRCLGDPRQLYVQRRRERRWAAISARTELRKIERAYLEISAERDTRREGRNRLFECGQCAADLWEGCRRCPKCGSSAVRRAGGDP